jgi:hypothetical protein
MRRLAAPALVALGGVPLLVAPLGLVTWLAGAAVLLCGSGLVWRSPGFTRAGCLVALTAFALGLWESAGTTASAVVLAGATLGGAFLVLIEATASTRRLRGTRVHQSALAFFAKRWLVQVTIAFALVTGLYLASTQVSVSLPVAWRPVAAAAGAVGSFLAIVWRWRR